ncbi:glucose 1-dehydrogenase [Weissella diestrammenae]|uniref:Glucose 1-dehydrogenase n=1 Tax=Weissella diestrammenae TaxID=1162633 RepID=A0A7G9T6X9_9LACO|nr:glucose 1-dehydrogenase [Weissella diestrammenae]MCM0582550.1 glucose 1-dehydrogenase [Weissella diestrammenae]QNN75854.1 glucose 1-dehydrogenase [Weissella diestrammenae]
MTGRLTGKVAIVTGGTLGIGLAVATQFVAEGAKVVITGRRANVGEEAVASIGGPEVIRFVQHDAADEAGWIDLFEQTIAWFGHVDTVVNNAGIAIGKNIEETTFDDWKLLQSINSDGVFLGTKYGVQYMKNQPGGASIINMSSIEGFVGDPNLTAYNHSKGGVRIMSKSAALHCALNDYNLRVNTVHPGYIKTPLVGNLEGAEEAQSQRTQTPVGHIGEPNDIAYICVYLASEESKYATGAEFVVDGGYLAK